MVFNCFCLLFFFLFFGSHHRKSDESYTLTSQKMPKCITKLHDTSRLLVSMYGFPTGFKDQAENTSFVILYYARVLE